MVEKVDVEGQDANTQVAVGEENEPSYEDMFEEEWGDGEDATTPEDEETDEDEVVDPDDESGTQGSADETDEDDSSTAQANTSEETTTDPDDPYAWINTLPDDVKNQVHALKHRADSDQGRVAAHQRRVNDLQAELDRMNSRRSAATADKDSDDPAAAPELPEKFKQLKEDFPEFADAVEAIREFDRQQYNQELEEKLQPFEQERMSNTKQVFNQTVSEEAEKIFNTEETGVHWQDVVKGEDFRAWLDMQPNSVKTAAGTPDPTEAIYVLNMYERDYQAAIAENDSNQNEQKPVQKEELTPSRADEVKSRRTQRKAAGVTPGSKPIISDPNNEGGDYDSEFDRQWG